MGNSNCGLHSRCGGKAARIIANCRDKSAFVENAWAKVERQTAHGFNGSGGQTDGFRKLLAYFTIDAVRNIGCDQFEIEFQHDEIVPDFVVEIAGQPPPLLLISLADAYSQGLGALLCPP